jgi:Transposase IS116/IS110/IS902 family
MRRAHRRLAHWPFCLDDEPAAGGPRVWLQRPEDVAGQSRSANRTPRLWRGRRRKAPAPWPNAKHFTSWLCLAPANKISGGKVLSTRTRRSGSRAAALLRLAAVTVGRTQTALGAFYRRLSARVGKAKAVTATARKIATLFYNTLRHGFDHADPGASYYGGQISRPGSRQPPTTREVSRLHAERDAGASVVSQEVSPRAWRRSGAKLASTPIA